jgi:hypothetical protein
MVQEFGFKEGTRTFTCTVETRKGTEADAWWWFAVSGDNQRYAPFRTARGDTRESVQERIVQFYNDRLFALTQPTQRGSHWGKRNAPGTAAPTPVSVPKAD